MADHLTLHDYINCEDCGAEMTQADYNIHKVSLECQKLCTAHVNYEMCYFECMLFNACMYIEAIKG